MGAKKQRWSVTRALAVYRTVFPDDPIYPGDRDPRQNEIVSEVNAVRMADSVKDAAEIIDWWGWDDEWTAIKAAVRIRRFK